MQPQQPAPNLQPNPMPSNYLDQIAVPQNKPGMGNKLFLGVIGGALLIVIMLVVGMVLSSGGSSKAISTQRLALRLQTLQKVADDSHKNIKSSTLRSIDSNLTAYLVNANRDIETPLKAANIDIKKLDKKLVAEEDGKKLTAALEDARLNATFDRTYAREMSYQLETTATMMSSLYKTTKSKSLKSFLEPSYKDIKSLQKQFSDFSASSS